MAAKNTKEIVLNIKGRDWKFILMSDRAFDKLHNSNENPDENNSVAMTCIGIYEAHFRKSDWNIITVRHEIGHIVYRMGLNSSTQHTPLQVEEAFAEIIGHNCCEIALWADRICERFFED